MPQEVVISSNAKIKPDFFFNTLLYTYFQDNNFERYKEYIATEEGVAALQQKVLNYDLFSTRAVITALEELANTVLASQKSLVEKFFWLSSTSSHFPELFQENHEMFVSLVTRSALFLKEDETQKLRPWAIVEVLFTDKYFLENRYVFKNSRYMFKSLQNNIQYFEKEIYRICYLQLKKLGSRIAILERGIIFYEEALAGETSEAEKEKSRQTLIEIKAAISCNINAMRPYLQYEHLGYEHLRYQLKNDVFRDLNDNTSFATHNLVAEERLKRQMEEKIQDLENSEVMKMLEDLENTVNLLKRFIEKFQERIQHEAQLHLDDKVNAENLTLPALSILADISAYAITPLTEQQQFKFDRCLMNSIQVQTDPLKRIALEFVTQSTLSAAKKVEIADLIVNPNRIDQGDSNYCGLASILGLIAYRNAIYFSKLCIKLAKKNKKENISVSALLLEYLQEQKVKCAVFARPKGYHFVTVLGEVGATADTLKQYTTPLEIEALLNLCGLRQTFSTIHFKNMNFENIYVYSGIELSKQSVAEPQKENFVEKIQSFIEKEGCTILSVSPLIVKALGEYSTDPDSIYEMQASHYVVLTGIKKIENDFLLLIVDTYGQKFNIKISRDDFFKHCFGTIEYALKAPVLKNESKVEREAVEAEGCEVNMHYCAISSPLLQFSDALVTTATEPLVATVKRVAIVSVEIAETEAAAPVVVSTNNEAASPRAVLNSG